MRVLQKVLPPGMKNTEEANLRAEVLGVGGDFQQRVGTRAEQEIVQQFLVLQNER